MGDFITPAVELASDADSFNSFTSVNTTVHPDWTQMMQSYDQDYETQVATIKDRMQRYHALSASLATSANF